MTGKWLGPNFALLADLNWGEEEEEKEEEEIAGKISFPGRKDNFSFCIFNFNFAVKTVWGSLQWPI